MRTTIDQTLLNAKAFAFGLLLITPLTALAQPSVIGPYTLKTFAVGPTDSSKPDSITVDFQRNVWVSFTNGVAPDGSDSKFSTVIEYSPHGIPIFRYPILGSNDGLKYNPRTGTIWALRNQDGNPALTVIHPKGHTWKNYTFDEPLHGGGYDDVVFRDGKNYISASNPTLNQQGFNPAPSILRMRRFGTGNTIHLTPVLSGDAFAINKVSGQRVRTVQTDPDSMTVDRQGNLVLDSQADSILLFVSNPGTHAQNVLELPLTDGSGNPVQVDDTVFPASSKGTIYFTDSGTNTIYALESVSFDTNVGYSSSGPSIGTVNLSTGVYTPVVTGLSSSHGATFVRADADDNDRSDHDGETDDF